VEIRITIPEAEHIIREWMGDHGYTFICDDPAKQVQFKNDGQWEDIETFQAFIVMP